MMKKIFLLLLGIFLLNPNNIIATGTSEKVFTAGDGYDGSTQNLVQINGVNFFTYDDGIHGRELWRSDGTEDGSFLVKDINSGEGIGSDPEYLIVYHNKIYFKADDGTNGDELWVSDGLESGTSLFKDIVTGPNGSSISGPIIFNDLLFFNAYNEDEEFEIWKTDGSQSGTVKFDLSEILSGVGEINYSAIIGNNLYFTGESIGGSQNDSLVKTDGTVAGTQIVKTLTDNSIFYMSLFSDGTHIYFFTPAGTTTELWISDGTEANTMFVKDILVGGESNYPRNFFAYNNKVYFSAKDRENDFGHRLFVTDGTEIGTHLVTEEDKAFNPFNFVLYNNLLYFSGYDNEYGDELWRTDGTAEGTLHALDNLDLKDENDDGSSIGYILKAVDKLLLFIRGKDPDEYSYILKETDGTTIRTISDRIAYDEGSIMDPLVFDDWVYYLIATEYQQNEEDGPKYWGNGLELWKYSPNGDSPTPTPTTTPSNNNSSNNNSSPPTYSCTNSKPLSVSDLFQINTTNKSAKIFFTPLSDTNQYYISFSEQPNAEKHGEQVTLLREGVQSHTIYFLKPNTTYYVKVRGQNGCMPGDWSNIMKFKTNSKNQINQKIFYKYINFLKNIISPFQKF